MYNRVYTSQKGKRVDLYIFAMKHSKQHRQSYSQIASESRLIALTGLNQAAFTALCSAFAPHWHAYISVYRLNGTRRQRRLSAKKTDVLPSIEDKVFFLLKYLKTNPLQEELAHDFAMSQPQANMWIHALLPVLQTTLQTMQCAPAPTGEELSRILEQYEYVLVDGSERPIQRPADIQKQKASYSGKKSIHSKERDCLRTEQAGTLCHDNDRRLCP